MKYFVFWMCFSSLSCTLASVNEEEVIWECVSLRNDKQWIEDCDFRMTQLELFLCSSGLLQDSTLLSYRYFIRSLAKDSSFVIKVRNALNAYKRPLPRLANIYEIGDCCIMDARLQGSRCPSVCCTFAEINQTGPTFTLLENALDLLDEREFARYSIFRGTILTQAVFLVM